MSPRLRQLRLCSGQCARSARPCDSAIHPILIPPRSPFCVRALRVRHWLRPEGAPSSCTRQLCKPYRLRVSSSTACGPHRRGVSSRTQVPCASVTLAILCHSGDRYPSLTCYVGTQVLVWHTHFPRERPTSGHRDRGPDGEGKDLSLNETVSLQLLERYFDAAESARLDPNVSMLMLPIVEDMIVCVYDGSFSLSLFCSTWVVVV